MIKRDGRTTSLWQAESTAFSSSKQEKAKNDLYDVIIVGGGIAGISTALALQEAGMSCIVLEAYNLCYGTTGGTTAHLNTLLDTPYTTIEKNFGQQQAAYVAEGAAAALSLIRSNIKKNRIECGYQEASAFLFAQNEKEEKELDEILQASARAGLDIGYENEMPFPFSFTKLVKAKGQGKFNPLNYVYGLASAFELLDGHIIQDCPVIDVQQNKIIEAVTGKGKFKGRHLIYATHIPPGVNLLHLRCTAYRTYAMAVKLDKDIYPPDLAYDMLDPYHYYRCQKVNGCDYLIAGGKDHKTGDGVNTEYLFTRLEATVREHFDVKEIAYNWSSQYFEPADGLPYIGHLPGHPDNIYVATGFGGNGMPYSHVAAALLTDMILGKENKLEEIFNPNRIKPVAGFVNFINTNAAVVSNFAGKLFSAEKMHALSELAAGEGKIVQYEGEKIGLYKDEQHRLHAVHPVCTHLKCEVAWNATELSWDCPCHGARYNYDGAVITGPADRPLEKIVIQ